MISEAIQMEKHNQQGVKKCSGRRVKMMEEQTTKNKKREREREREGESDLDSPNHLFHIDRQIKQKREISQIMLELFKPQPRGVCCVQNTMNRKVLKNGSVIKEFQNSNKRKTLNVLESVYKQSSYIA